MKRLASISVASAVIISSSCVPPAAAEAQWQGVNEKQWAESIQSDIRNKSSAIAICTNSTNFATTSKEAAFKNWANSIAQKYCTAEGKNTESSTPIANKKDHCRLDSSDIYNISTGKKFRKQGKDCWASFN
jgi:hypothetical protein